MSLILKIHCSRYISGGGISWAQNIENVVYRSVSLHLRAPCSLPHPGRLHACSWFNDKIVYRSFSHSQHTKSNYTLFAISNSFNKFSMIRHIQTWIQSINFQLVSKRLLLLWSVDFSQTHTHTHTNLLGAKMLSSFFFLLWWNWINISHTNSFANKLSSCCQWVLFARVKSS